MLDWVLKNKKTVIIGGIILVILFFAGGRSAEDTAKEFVEASLKGDAKKVVSLMSDIVIEESPYETEKLLIHALEEKLENRQDSYKSRYGEKWKYKVKVIDSYPVDFSEIEDYVEISELSHSHMKNVAITVQHKGKGWFNDKEGSEDKVIRCIKQGRKWYVLYEE